jgi:hypothetical protein
VYYLEDAQFLEDDDYTWFYDPTDAAGEGGPDYGLRFVASAFLRFDIGERWAFYDARESEWRGPAANRILDVLATADIVLNVSGINPLRPWLMQVPVRVLVDTDPAFSQVRHLTDPSRRRLALQHTAFVSFGENIVYGRSSIPSDGLPWLPSRQPILLQTWRVSPGPTAGAFTSVMMWDSYRNMEYDHRIFGQKSDSFSPLLDLPQRTGPILELALFSGSGPRRLLRRNGWMLRDGGKVTRDPWSYQRYIQRSKAEFSVAKHGYVVSNSGWFSERSANYLASGRPVVVQDTGFTDWMQTGAGVLPFTNPDEAVAAIEEVNRRYEYHCRAAREVAEEYFDSDKVLTSLIERAMAPGV